MAKQSAFVEYLLSDALSHIAGVSSRRMFGGYGIYKDEVIFGLVIDEVLYLKTDQTTQSDFEAIESKAFSYEKKSKQVMITSYWSIPERIIEDREEIQSWVEKAVQVSLRAKNK